MWTRRSKRSVGREPARGSRPWLTARREAAGPGRTEACRRGAAEARPARGTLWGEAARPWGATLRRELPRRRAALGWEALRARRPTHAARHGTGMGTGMRTGSGRSAHRWRALSWRRDGVGAHGLTRHA